MTDEELWVSSEWTETDFDRHPWMKRNRSEMREGAPTRWFVPKGRRWPLISISVYRDYPSRPPGVSVSTSCKDAPDGWFRECSLPAGLLPQLIEMLTALIVDRKDPQCV